MASTTFVDQVTPVVASWLNDVNNATYNGIIGAQTINYSDTGIAGTFASTVAGYAQVIYQNKSAATNASTNINVSNNAASSSVNFAEFGINSSTFTGTGSFNQAGNAYLASASTDLVIGTYAAKPIRFVVNSGATDAMTISSAGLVTFGTLPAQTAGSGANTDITSLNSHPVGKMIGQIITSTTGAVATGTTVVPFDDTIPQNTEGDQYLSAAITPQNTASLLEIDVTLTFCGSAAVAGIGSLFQDSNANALCTAFGFVAAIGAPITSTFKHTMLAGTTSATTFKVRLGPSSAATITLNGQGGGRLFGGVMASRITIKEYLP